MLKSAQILVLAGLLCYCWMGGSKGQKPEAGRPKDPCSLWEVELRNQLLNASTIMPLMQSNHLNLYKISDKCILSFSHMSNLTVVRELMKELSLVYDRLNPGSRVAIFKWIEGIYAMKSSADKGDSNKTPVQGDPSKGKDAKSSWITSDVLTLLDRFILQAPMSTLSSLAGMANSSICSFYKSNTTVWSRLYDLSAGQAKCLTDGLIKCGVNVTHSRVIPSLGQLPCFFTDLVEQMNPDAREALRNVLPNCTRNVKDMYQKLLKSMNSQNLTSDMLKSLGKAASGLNLAQIYNLSASAINQSLESLGRVNSWSMQQRRALAKKVNVSEQDLSKMGALAAGLGVKKLHAIPGREILKALNSSEDFANSTKFMSPAQRKAIIGAVLKDEDVNAVLRQLPRNLVREIPLGTLKAINANVAEEMLKKNPDLSPTQAIALMRKVKLETLNNSKAISDLNSGVRGLTCGHINQLNMDALRALGNSTFISPYQLTCAAKQFFKLMNTGHLSALTQEELAKIPGSFLLYQPSFKDLKTIPAPLCPSVLALLGQADIKLQGRSSARRGEMLNFIKSCLNITDTKTLTADQASALGSLVCTFGEDEITSLPSSIFQGILSQLMTCGRFEGSAKEALRQKILSTFNTTSTWTQDMLKQLGILAAVLSKEDLAAIPNTEDVKFALVGILSSAAVHKEGFMVPDFDNSPELKFLAEKLSSIYSNPAAVSSTMRKRRAADCTNTAPSADMINILGEYNAGWKPEQLNCLTDESFMNGLDTLSKVQCFTNDQLTVLKNKALQVYGNPLPMDQIAALKRITLALSDSEVTASFNGVDTDTLAEISGFKEWATSSYKLRSDTIVKYYLSNGRSMASLSDTDLVALGYFLCVQMPDQIQQVNKTAFSGAAMHIGKLLCPDNSVLMALKNKALEAFGAPSNWTGEVCQELGSVTAGLTSAEISQLQEGVMPFLTPEAISLLPAKVFASLSPAQLKNLGPENSATVSDQQRSSLSLMQREALAGSESSASGTTLWMPMSAFTLVAISLLIATY